MTSRMHKTNILAEMPDVENKLTLFRKFPRI